MRGWEARLTAGVRARCARRGSGRQSNLKALTSLLGLVRGKSGWLCHPARRAGADEVLQERPRRATRQGCARRDSAFDPRRAHLSWSGSCRGRAQVGECTARWHVDARGGVCAAMNLPCHNSTQIHGVWWCLGARWRVRGGARKPSARSGAAEGSGAPGFGFRSSLNVRRASKDIVLWGRGRRAR